MKQEVNNFKRLFGVLNKLQGIYDRDATIADLVWQYSNHRTTELKEIGWQEYVKMCSELEAKLTNTSDLKRQRSVCLKLMQVLGIDTTDWQRINAFCQDKRISGKPFYPLTIDELKQVQRKLWAIERNGGLKERSLASKSIRYDFIIEPTIEGEKQN